MFVQSKAGGTLPAAVAQKLLRALAALDAGAVPDMADSVPHGRDPSSVDVAEAEELDLSYVRSKGTSLLFGPLVKCATPPPYRSTYHTTKKRHAVKQAVENLDIGRGLPVLTMFDPGTSWIETLQRDVARSEEELNFLR